MFKSEKENRPTDEHLPALMPIADDSSDGQSVPLPVALREVPLLPEAAREMQRRLDDPNYRAHGGKAMPTADASVLLGKRE